MEETGSGDGVHTEALIIITFVMASHSLVLQGSVLGPTLFILYFYIADLVTLVLKSSLLAHLYADDTQICGACWPAHIDAFLSNVNKCLSIVADWMHSSRLQLNSDKLYD